MYHTCSYYDNRDNELNYCDIRISIITQPYNDAIFLDTTDSKNSEWQLHNFTGEIVLVIQFHL